MPRDVILIDNGEDIYPLSHADSRNEVIIDTYFRKELNDIVLPRNNLLPYDPEDDGQWQDGGDGKYQLDENGLSIGYGTCISPYGLTNAEGKSTGYANEPFGITDEAKSKAESNVDAYAAEMEIDEHGRAAKALSYYVTDIMIDSEYDYYSALNDSRCKDGLEPNPYKQGDFIKRVKESDVPVGDVMVNPEDDSSSEGYDLNLIPYKSQIKYRAFITSLKTYPGRIRLIAMRPITIYDFVGTSGSSGSGGSGGTREDARWNVVLRIIGLRTRKENGGRHKTQ